MITRLNLEDNKIKKDIIQLQCASYQVEARLIGFYDLPPLKDTLESIQKCGEIFYGYYLEDILAGIISYKSENHILDIHRVAVHPDYFRRGIAGELLHFIEEAEANINEIEVCTGKENLPALQLYLKNGFRKCKDIEIEKGVYLTLLKKLIY